MAVSLPEPEENTTCLSFLAVGSVGSHQQGRYSDFLSATFPLADGQLVHSAAFSGLWLRLWA